MHLIALLAFKWGFDQQYNIRPSSPTSPFPTPL